MKKKRLIPILLLRNGWLVQSKSFEQYQNLGNPSWAVKRLSEWASDELIYLDISRDNVYDLRRDDLAHPNRGSFLDIIQDVAKMCFMPITVGGQIRTLEDIRARLTLGADKVSLNTQALKEPAFIEKAAAEFGSQCIVISVDYRNVGGQAKVFADGGRLETGYTVEEWVCEAQRRGAGEVLLNSIDRDGMRLGYDITLLDKVSATLRIPVIACGGVGEWQHFAEALQKTQVDAVAAANIFHYTDQSVFMAKKHLFERGLSVRSPDLLTVD